jgi:hypothetical protein
MRTIMTITKIIKYSLSLVSSVGSLFLELEYPSFCLFFNLVTQTIFLLLNHGSLEWTNLTNLPVQIISFLLVIYVYQR